MNLINLCFSPGSSLSDENITLRSDNKSMSQEDNYIKLPQDNVTLQPYNVTLPNDGHTLQDNNSTLEHRVIPLQPYNITLRYNNVTAQLKHISKVHHDNGTLHFGNITLLLDNATYRQDQGQMLTEYNMTFYGNVEALNTVDDDLDSGEAMMKPTYWLYTRYVMFCKYYVWTDKVLCCFFWGI